MAFICPLCNGMEAPSPHCPQCGEAMGDQGMIEDFFGPYSPYQERDLYMWQQEIGSPELGDDYCVHLFYCPHCQYDYHVPIKLIEGTKMQS